MSEQIKQRMEEVVYSDDCSEEWEPKLYEWCWFISCNDTFELMQFVRKLTNGQYQAKTLHGTVFNYGRCEPFKGKLPSQIKNLKEIR